MLTLNEFVEKMNFYGDRLDEVHGVFRMDDGSTRRPSNPEERSELAKGLRAARNYNRQNRDYNKANPIQGRSDDEVAKQSKRDNMLSRGARSAYSVVPDGPPGTGKQQLRGVMTKHGTAEVVEPGKQNFRTDLPNRPIRSGDGKASKIAPKRPAGF